ncbi:uncharacterized protein P174DRAFT_441523 [Aspergillus novofumigatus IBT 16806]|uniref:Uncharacterized protein n=1 Tax=Aspergillus novofumigatus (strain IBT 16806) TaxID=1392255 RepID=A0A2I1C9H3_ASPN1|nr:uncharacterized protein P174DRAFT_441523 [Aspergillus novofumigatus IBT 16806]PKX94241.1 hypothetical protein P174DRAFT_441523 [Aspergillus novofumigatus IBT 16806]
MDFVRLHGVPVPRILTITLLVPNTSSWRKLPGNELGELWYTMTKRQRLKMIFEIVKIEALLYTQGTKDQGNQARLSLKIVPEMGLPMMRNRRPQRAPEERRSLLPALELLSLVLFVVVLSLGLELACFGPDSGAFGLSVVWLLQ